MSRRGASTSERGREVLELLGDVCREREVAVLLVTRDPQAAGYADHVHSLRDGRLEDVQPNLGVVSREREIGGCRMKLRSIVYLYRVRLRSRLVQELLALAGIAVGVALLFASQVAGADLTGSVEQLTSGIVVRRGFSSPHRAPYWVRSAASGRGAAPAGRSERRACTRGAGERDWAGQLKT